MKSNVPYNSDEDPDLSKMPDPRQTSALDVPKLSFQQLHTV